ncbi:MAG TPA: PDZ domain-containing protein, partial [Terriglobales bacterium]
ITSDRLSALHLKEERGVEVTMVDQDAPAGKAGIKEHDVILSINGTQVESVEQLRRLIREVPPGRTITVGLSRDGQPLSLKAQLADRKKAFAFPDEKDFKDFKNFKFEMPAMPSVAVTPMIPDVDVPVSVVVIHSALRSGLMVENLTPQLGDFFGVRNGHGVLVRSVEKGSRAEQAGFHAGDVIVKINDQPVEDSGDFGHSLRSRKDNSVRVGIIRDKKEQTLTLTLPERKRSELEEETFDLPEIDAETRVELGQLSGEIAMARPQMELAIAQASKNADQIRKQVCEQQAVIQKQVTQLKQQQKQMKRQLLEQKKQIRIQMSRGTLDI